MTDHQFNILWGEASTSPDRAVFVSDSALSAIWGDPEGYCFVPPAVVLVQILC